MATAAAVRNLVLGSSSKSRQLILTELGYDFIIITPNINEKDIGDRNITSPSSPAELVLQIARAKTTALLTTNVIPTDLMTSVLITADTVVVHQDKVLEKPSNELEFRQNMKSYSNSFCTLYSSLIATDLISGKQLEGVDVATLHFDEIPETAIDNLLNEGKIFDCAGGIMVENPILRPYISTIEGSEHTVKGLASSLLSSFLDQLR